MHSPISAVTVAAKTKPIPRTLVKGSLVSSAILKDKTT
jgi:hypothetical protein